jgi:predicted nucleic acid-binding protein
MVEAISNTSPLLYLYRIGRIEWLPAMFEVVWVSSAVVRELDQGRAKGYSVPHLPDYGWVKNAEPRFMPSEWLALDLGLGELATMALALEHTDRVVLLDDGLARRVARAAGLTVWGTLKIVLEAKGRGLIQRVEPIVQQLDDAGMWMSVEIRERILKLADEA